MSPKKNKQKRKPYKGQKIMQNGQLSQAQIQQLMQGQGVKLGQQAPTDPLEAKAAALMQQFNQLRQAIGTQKGNYVQSYAKMVSDVAQALFTRTPAQALFTRTPDSDADACIKVAIDFAEKCRIAIHTYSQDVVNKVPIDPALLEAETAIEAELKAVYAELDARNTPKEPLTLVEKTESEKVHEATSSGPKEVEAPKASHGADPIESV